MGSKSTRFTLAICTVLILAPTFPSAQCEGQETMSLGDLAREQRRKNSEESKQTAKVYSNDDFPELPPKAPSTESATKTPAAGMKKGNAEAEAISKASSSEPHDEKYFRRRMDELRANLESDKRRLATLQEEMDKHMRDSLPDSPGGALSYQENPHWTTNPIGFNSFWNSEDKRLRSSIDSQKEKIATDEGSISDLIVQCRREDCQPGWIR